jgi:polyribonucleotide nucleotidyltransferase
MRLMPNDPLAGVPCHFTMQLTNEQAGAVLGVKGSNISAIIKMSGAKVSIQSRNEVAEGDYRNLDIQGQLDGCSTALGMVVSKLRETSRHRNSHSRGGEGRNGRRNSTSERT